MPDGGSSMVMVIEKGTLKKGCMQGEVCAVSGAGRGIGLEAARSLAWLGAKVVIAEIDRRTGEDAAARINGDFGKGSALFVQTDVSDEKSVQAMAKEAIRKYGKVDVVLNNATVFRMGAVTDVPAEGWDFAYGVNVRGPVLMAQAFLPGMIERDHGAFVCVSSSGAAPYMGAYEVFKTAQVELSRVIDAELEGKKVNAFTIGPGLARTPGSEEGIRVLAPLYGKTVEEFHAMSKEVQITAEEAGAGFAAAIALADRFRGQEISSFASLGAIGIAVGIDVVQTGDRITITWLTDEQWSAAEALCHKALVALTKQHRSWLEMSVFKRQWILRDFKNGAGMPIEQWLDTLRSLEAVLKSRDGARLSSTSVPLDKLSAYFSHMIDLLVDYEKDREKLRTGKAAIEDWKETVDELRAIVGSCPIVCQN
jgi:NAD(P)-dependent dehydrogenase (short-subunit alcohol dehydrogenase family)